MKYIERSIQKNIEKWLFKGKIITIYGARQVGKTTLSKKLLQKFGQEKDYFNCDYINVREAFENQNPNNLKKVVGDSKFIVIDEAQRVRNIGVALKIIHDNFPDIQVVATGSSSFELANKINEPLTGRGLEFILFPFSMFELQQKFSFLELKELQEQTMRFGSYPEIIDKNETDSIFLLENLAGKYLYKDILDFEQIKKPDLLLNLLKLLSFQLGNEVSKHELATTLSVNRDTIERYLDLLEKAFVIFRLKSFSRNLRKELTKKEKIYFFDIGIRNSLISRYNQLAYREDIGGLFENFCIVERMKYLQRNEFRYNRYFWRTHDKKEVDYLEEFNNQLSGFEFKWSKGRFKVPVDFINTYKNSTVSLINKENVWDFIL